MSTETTPSPPATGAWRRDDLRGPRREESSWAQHLRKRKADGRCIDEDVQGPIRDRLRLMREARGIPRTSISKDNAPGCSSSSLTTYELHDISTMTLAQMWSLWRFYGMDFNEFIAAVLLGDETVIPQVSGEVAHLSRLISKLSPEDAQMATDLVESIIDTRLKQMARRAGAS